MSKKKSTNRVVDALKIADVEEMGNMSVIVDNVDGDFVDFVKGILKYEANNALLHYFGSKFIPPIDVGKYN